MNLWELAVDTTEELNNTYFYAGRPNLTAGELFFMIFCEEVAEQLGIDDFGAIVAILSGRNVLTTRTKNRAMLSRVPPMPHGQHAEYSLTPSFLSAYSSPPS